MAKTKEEKQIIESAVEAEAVEAVEEIKEEKQTKTSKQTGPSYDELISLVQQLSNEVASLKSGTATVPQAKENNIEEILSLLANRKSEREVAIVHNRELAGGLTTHIHLSTVDIDFTHVGEERLLTWQQFEECVSKYRSFFKSEIILVSDEYADVAVKYNVPCVHRSDANHVLTHNDIMKLGTMSVPELEKLIGSLGDADKDTVFNYWLGKCYTKEPSFYDRYKMDTLNRLSNGSFTNILLVMNGDTTAVGNENK